MRKRLCSIAVIAGVFAGANPGRAADGYFDTGWIGGGRTTFITDPQHGGNAGPANSGYLGKLIVQSNGDLLVAGMSLQSAAVAWWLGRLTPDGQLDNTFGITPPPGFFFGRVSRCQLGLDCSVTYAYSDFLQQPDGGIVVLSSGDRTRLNANGTTLDTAGVSGGTGSVTASNIVINTGTGYVQPNAMVRQTDGKFILAGSGYTSSADAFVKFGVVRLNADLSVDTTFAGGGSSWGALVRVDATDDAEYLSSLLLQPDGHIVVIGIGSKGSANTLDLARLNSDGSPDASFGNAGVAELTPQVAVADGVSGLLDRSGRILVALSVNASNAMEVARITPGGQLDATFNGGFFVDSSASIGACTNVGSNALAIDSAGRIVVGGYCDADFFVERVRGDDGTLDTSFGIGGRSFGVFSDSSSRDGVSALVFDAGGRLMVGGNSTVSGVGQAGVARLTYDLLWTNNFEATPRGCSPPDCN